MKRLFTKRNPVTTGFLLLSIFYLTGCQGYESSIPERPVYIKRNIYTNGLSSSGSSLYIDKTSLITDRIGFGGILIVHSFNSLDGADGYYAFDLSCPVEHKSAIRIGKPNQSLFCACDSCDEIYDLSMGVGAPTKNISKETLKRYTVHLDDANNIIVTR